MAYLQSLLDTKRSCFCFWCEDLECLAVNLRKAYGGQCSWIF